MSFVRKLLAVSLTYLVAVSFSNGASLDDDLHKTKEQSIIIPQKDFPTTKSEEELIEYIASYFDYVNPINILDANLKYDQDKVRYLSKKTGLHIGFVDQRVGRVVLEYDDALSFGTGSFLEQKIFTNAHVLKGFPLAKKMVFEQGLSLVLREDFDVDAVSNGLKKYKDSFLNFELYETNKKHIESMLTTEVLSVYDITKRVNVLKEYFHGTKHHDIGYIDDYTTDQDLSKFSFRYSKAQKPTSDLQSKKIFKLTHYPLGIPIQRTSYGYLDFKTNLHRMHTLGGSSGSLIQSYDSHPIGLHSAGTGNYYLNKKTSISVSEQGNKYEDFSSFEKQSEYVKLDRGIVSRLLSNTKNSFFQKGLISLLTKNRLRM